MDKKHGQSEPGADPTRRRFLRELGAGAVVGAVAGPLSGAKAAGAESSQGQVKRRPLGKTGLSISEIGFGGHSWSYRQIPDGDGYRKTTVDEAVEMIAAGIDMGVNFFDSCTPLEESSTPGVALKRLKARDKAIIAVRVSHKMKGLPSDKEEIQKWTDQRLKLWQIDHVDVLMLCNTENDTPRSGYWDMSHSIEGLERMKEQGKARFTGFGCHFTPELFLDAFDRYGDYFDVCSIPYNVRHRAAEKVLPAAKKAGLGVITIKPFARGSLLKKRDLAGEDAGLPRDMLAFVLENEQVDCCTCGVHTMAQVRENFAASWTELSPAGRRRLDLAAAAECGGHRWLEEGWRYA